MSAMSKIQAPVRKRGRPAKSASADSPSARDRLVDTAVRLFYQHGIHAVGVDRIIEESEVAKKTFFNHFPTKRDLVLEFLRVRDERYMKWFSDTLDSITLDKKKRLAAAIRVIEMWFRDPNFRGCAFINTSADVGVGGREEKNICVSHKKRLADFLEGLAKEAGHPEPGRLASQLVTLIDGATVRAQMDGAEAGVAVLKDTAGVLLERAAS
jgi:AcrR family transcriptional regulator